MGKPSVQNAIQSNPVLGPSIGIVAKLMRIAAQDKVANYIAFLCSSSARSINDTTLPTDEGLTASCQHITSSTEGEGMDWYSYTKCFFITRHLQGVVCLETSGLSMLAGC